MYDEMFGVKEKEEKIKVFGRDIFNRKNLTFEPEMNIAMPQDYRLGRVNDLPSPGFPTTTT